MNIHTYPENADSVKLAYYRAAVQHHHETGGRIEYRHIGLRSHGEAGWRELTSRPSWSWYANDYRAMRPPVSKSEVDPHTYPTDPALLPAYTIAVMRAHHEQGLEVEENTCLNGWYLSRGSPTWNWGTTRYRICRPKIAEGHNPALLTEEQVGVKDGWRLLAEDEICERERTMDIESWHAWSWLIAGYHGASRIRTYRTRKPPGYFLPWGEKSVRDLDRKAFYSWRSGSVIDNCYLDTWLAARESLRKELGL